MPQISHIKFSDIKEARRCDAEYFKPEYLEIDNNLRRLRSEDLGKYCVFIKKGIFDISPTKYRKRGIPFLRVSNTKSFFINDEDMVFLDEETHQENSKTELRRGDIILSKVGTIGDAAINFDYERVNFSQNNVGIKIKHNEINSAYVIAFFNSKYGRKQVEKQQSGQVQEKIVLDDIKFLKIPRLHNEKIIADKVNQAYQKQTQSKQLYREAEELLLRDLGLLNYEVGHTLSFFTTKKAIQEAGRYDAEYFQPKYEEVIKKIEKYEGGCDFVKNQFKQNTTLSRKDGEYCNYIEISDVNTTNGEITPNKIETKDIPANGKRKLFLNDLIISKVRPYRGAISFIDFEVDNLLGSGAFTVLQEKTEYKKEVLMIFFKTFFIKDLLLRYNCGTSYPVIKDEDILNLKIPLIKPLIQRQIAEKIQESHKLRKESKNLLEEAKRAVEIFIEKDEKKALAYLKI